MTNTTNTETATETQLAAEHATLVRLETRSQELRRRALSSELAEAICRNDKGLAKVIRRQIGEVDRALMELGAGRLPQ